MASTSETGHAINVANFEELISYCIGYGGSYNPVKLALQIVAMQGLRTTAQGNIQTVNAFAVALINVINARQIAFEPLKALATRIVNALDATNATNELVKDAKTINRKIQGERKTKATNPTTPTPPAPPAPPIPPTGPTGPTPVPPTPTQISVSQQSYDSLLENFDRLTVFDSISNFFQSIIKDVLCSRLLAIPHQAIDKLGCE